MSRKLFQQGSDIFRRMPAGVLLNHLLSLETKGGIRQLPGKKFI
jgi:hypothetical protein